MESVQGRALVASPYLTDPNFLRSVVYMLRHDDEGALGLILNRPMQACIGSLLGQLTDEPIDNDRPVYCGGPVDGPLVLLQAIRENDTCALCVASEQSRILQTCQQQDDAPTEDYRLFDGYSGWGAAQLEDELRTGGWLLWDIEPQHVFSDPEQLWETAVQQIGRDILSGGIDPSRIPDDPAFN